MACALRFHYTENRKIVVLRGTGTLKKEKGSLFGKKPVYLHKLVQNPNLHEATEQNGGGEVGVGLERRRGGVGVHERHLI